VETYLRFLIKQLFSDNLKGILNILCQCTLTIQNIKYCNQSINSKNLLTFLLLKLLDLDFETQAHVVLDVNGSCMIPIMGSPLYATHTIVVTYCVKLSKKKKNIYKFAITLMQ